jgi:hypothetical protein
MKTLFRVNYSLRTTAINNGEFLDDHKIEEFSRLSETNDLNEIFTDLFDIHRFDGIIGLVILGVEEHGHPKDYRGHFDIHYA